MNKLCPGSRFLFPACLNDYQLAFRYQSLDYAPGAVADIIFKHGSKVWGGIYEISETDLEALDEYERVEQGEYRRVEFNIQVKHNSYWVISYEVVNKLNKDLPPIPEYKQMLVQGIIDCRLPETYLKQVKNFLEELEAGNS